VLQPNSKPFLEKYPETDVEIDFKSELADNDCPIPDDSFFYL